MDQRIRDQGEPQTIRLARERPFRIGAVEVRPGTRELVGPAGRAVLEPRVMQVLVALARAGGEILTRDDLTVSCWGGRIVGEDALSRVISKLRRASEGVGRDGWRLETVTKVGYRLLPLDYDPDASAIPSEATGPPARGRRALLAMGGAGAAALAAGAIWCLTRPPDPSEKVRALYQKGRDALAPGLPEDTQQALGFLRTAVAEAPTYAPAWGALSLAYQASLLFTEPSRQAGVSAQARAAARRALELDPNEPQARAALALLEDVYQNWGPAEAVYRRALDLHGREAQLHYIYARLLEETGRFKAAVEQAQSAVYDDNFAPWHRFILTIALWGAGRVEEADRVAAEALAMWPRHYALWFSQLALLTYSGRADRALAMGADLANRPFNIAPVDVELNLSAARALLTGSAADIKTAVDLHLAAAHRGVGYSENAVTCLASLGRLDDAFAVARAMYFDEGFAMPPERFSGTFAGRRRRHTYILFLPGDQPMRSDPRFHLLMRDIGLSAYWKDARQPPDDPRWVPA